MAALDGIAVFVCIADSMSLTAAAKRLGISPAATSKSLSRLEESIGVRLVNRTTRRMSLTDDGFIFFQRCQQALADIEDAKNQMTLRKTSLTGRLRVHARVGFGRSVLVPLFAEFSKMHHDLTMDVELSDRVVDFTYEGVDVFVWSGDRNDSTVVAKKLSDIRYVVVASPQYLDLHGTPNTPADLKDHNILGYFFPHLNRYRDWNFSYAGKHLAQPLSGSLNFNNGPALLDAASEGLGIAMVPTFLACDLVRSGRLRVVLRDFTSAGPSVWIGYLARRNISPRIRALVDYLSTAVPTSMKATENTMKSIGMST